MADRELSNKLSSGEITQMKIGGTGSGNIVPTTDDLLANAPFAPSYDYNKVSSITVANDVYEEVNRLTTPSRVAGTYKLTQSMLYTLNTTTRSAYFRFSVDSGTTWTEIVREPKDNTDIIPLSYTQTIVHTGGIFEIIIEARKENAADVLTILIMDLIFERKV